MEWLRRFLLCRESARGSAFLPGTWQLHSAFIYLIYTNYNIAIFVSEINWTRRQLATVRFSRWLVQLVSGSHINPFRHRTFFGYHLLGLSKWNVDDHSEVQDSEIKRPWKAKQCRQSCRYKQQTFPLPLGEETECVISSVRGIVALSITRLWQDAQKFRAKSACLSINTEHWSHNQYIIL